MTSFDQAGALPKGKAGWCPRCLDRHSVLKDENKRCWRTWFKAAFLNEHSRSQERIERGKRNSNKSGKPRAKFLRPGDLPKTARRSLKTPLYPASKGQEGNVGQKVLLLFKCALFPQAAFPVNEVRLISWCFLPGLRVPKFWKSPWTTHPKRALVTEGGILCKGEWAWGIST